MDSLFDPLLSFDEAIFRWVQSVNWPNWLDKIMWLITNLGEAGIIWIVAAIVLLFFKKYRKAGFAMLVALAFMVICNNLILKSVFARPRPFDLEIWKDWFRYPDIVTRPDSYSFPSGHTSSSFAGAFALSYYSKDKKLIIPAIIMAILIALSRIYVCVHYPTDIIGGIAVGIIYGIIGVLIAKWLYPMVENFVIKLKAKKSK